ncbi:MAG: hypothetical protein ABI321_16635 [Polyangia bacterium]
MMNPIALVFRPGRVLSMCLLLVASLLVAAMTSTTGTADDEEISRVELID